MHGAVGVPDDEPGLARSFDCRHAVTGLNHHAEMPTASEQGIEHRSSLVGHGEELARRLPLKFNTQRREPLDRVIDRERGKHVLDDPAIPEKILRRDDMVRYVAAPSAGHQDLGADLRGPVQEHNARCDPPPVSRLRRKDRAGQSRRATAYDRDFVGFFRIGH